MPNLLFVYGTLMNGEPNHPVLGRAIYRGAERISGGFGLVSLGAYPALVRDMNGGNVFGEVYEITPETLAATDRLEGHPHLYQREVVTLDNGTPVWAYIMQRAADRPRIRCGAWRLYHALTYKEALCESE